MFLTDSDLDSEIRSLSAKIQNRKYDRDLIVQQRQGLNGWINRKHLDEQLSQIQAEIDRLENQRKQLIAVNNKGIIMEPLVVELHTLLVKHFNLSELETLCLYVRVDYDNLGGNEKSGKARELLLYLERHGRLNELRDAVLKQKPQFPWPGSDQNEPHKSASQISILFLAADPTDASRLRLGEEFREIQEKLKLAKLRDRFRLELPQLSVRTTDITQALLDLSPRIVHFSGHGTETGALCFENQMRKAHLVHPDALAALFEQFADQVNCVLLNACYSEAQAKSIAKYIKYVIGMNKAVGDNAAIAFTIGFYQALGAGRTVEDAHKLGCVQIRLQNIPEHLTPVLIHR